MRGIKGEEYFTIKIKDEKDSEKENENENQKNYNLRRTKESIDKYLEKFEKKHNLGINIT